MKLIKFNPDNSKYYTTNFIKGFESGSTRQFENDLSAIEDIKKEMQKEIEWAKEHGCDEWLGAYDTCLEIIDKYIKEEDE